MIIIIFGDAATAAAAAIKVLTTWFQIAWAKSAGAVEYSDCISEEG